MGIRMLHHICIQTDRYLESLEFYTKVMGFETVKESAGFHGRAFNTWLKMGSLMIELQTPKQDEVFSPWSSLNSGPVHLAFVVDDVEAEYERIKGLGHQAFKLKNGQAVYEVCGAKLLKVKAPEGTEIELRDTAIV